jgi:hypothetical protein
MTMVEEVEIQPMQAIANTTMRLVPNRPAISDVLIKASANVAFRVRLLTDPQGALAGMNLPREDAEILTDVQASSLKEYAHQVKMRLMIVQP